MQQLNGYCTSATIITRVAVTETTRRHWTNLSPLIYAAWSGNDNMMRRLMQALSQEDRPEAIAQLKTLRNHGSQYGKALAPLSNLIKAYRQYYVARKLGLWTYNKEKKFWLETVKSAERALPSNALLQLAMHYENETAITESDEFRDLSNIKQDINFIRKLQKDGMANLKKYIHELETLQKQASRPAL